MLKHLWPGNPKEHVGRINYFIRKYNATERKRSERVVALVCEREFFKFFGIMLVAKTEGVPIATYGTTKVKNKVTREYSTLRTT